MRKPDQERFDALLEGVLAELPQRVAGLIDEAPVIVDDRPSVELLRELGLDPREDDLCGLYSGPPITERSVLDPTDEPETIHLFREGIVDEAGGWAAGDDAVRSEIRITLLHEIGHHFGLDEDDLDALGYA